MKIIQITPAYKPAFIYGGPTMSVAKLCETLEKNKAQGAGNWDNYNIEVFTTTANGKVELDVKANESQLVDNVKVTYFKRLIKGHVHFSPALLWRIRNVFRDHKKTVYAEYPNKLVVHIHAWWNLVSVLTCLFAKWYNIPVVLSPRGMLTSYTITKKNTFAKQFIHHLVGKKLLKYSHIHVTSKHEYTQVLKFIKPNNITIIPNLVELNPYKTNQNQAVNQSTEKSAYKFIFLARIEEIKGLSLLFDALSLLDFDWTLTVAGSGTANYINNLQLKARNLKIAHRINWIGHVKNIDKFVLLANHDLMILTSYGENFANVVIESLSVGTPVLLSDHVGLADYVLANELGWVSELNSESIKNQLYQSFSSQEKRNQIRNIGPQLIDKDFNTYILVEKYINLYEKIS